MKLYNDSPWLPTDDGRKAEEDARALVGLFFQKWIDNGASPRELLSILTGVASIESSMCALKAQNAASKLKKKVLQEENKCLDKYDSGPHSNKGKTK